MSETPENSDNGPAGEPVDDPLAMPPWPSGAADDDEAAERERFEAAWAAFARGDFLRARQEATRLVRDARSEEVKVRAADLRHRLRTDPVAVVFGILAALFLGLVVLWAARS